MAAFVDQRDEESGRSRCHGKLPATNSVYNKKSYWDDRYKDEREFDWLGDFEGFRSLFTRFVPNSQQQLQPSILILGCGNSKLSRQLWDAGYRNLVSSDYSEVCIANQERWHREEGYTGIVWKVIDMTDMSDIKDGSYDVVVEKATLDAFYVEESSPWQTSPETVEKVDKCLSEISRILKPHTGKFISLSFSPEVFRVPTLANEKYNWDLQQEEFGNGCLPFLFYCMTKDKVLSQQVKNRFKKLLENNAEQPSETTRERSQSESSVEDFANVSKKICNIVISSSSSDEED